MVFMISSPRHARAFPDKADLDSMEGRQCSFLENERTPVTTTPTPTINNITPFYAHSHGMGRVTAKLLHVSLYSRRSFANVIAPVERLKRGREEWMKVPIFNCVQCFESGERLRGSLAYG